MNNLKIVLFSTLLLLSACSSIGPGQLQTDRLNYNYSLKDSSNKQLLLNIIRLRYTDNVFFLSVSSVVAQLSFTKSLTTTIGKVESGPLGGTVEPLIEYVEKPTVTYIPLGGEALVQRFLTPISLKVFYLLLRSGWGINHLMRVSMQKIGEIENAVNASRNVANHVPSYRKFMRLSWLLQQLQYSNKLAFRYGLINKRLAIRLNFSHLESLPSKDRKLLKEIGVTSRTPYAWLVDNYDNAPHHIHVEMRTMLGFMNYLSKGVDVPSELIHKKQAPMTQFPNGKYFDWRQVTKGMISIKSSRSRPKNSYVAIYYKGYWYYILDNDYGSKESFALLNILYNYLQGKISKQKPIFTIS